MLRRIVPLFALTLLAGTGCAYSPTYLPSFGFSGPISQTHAKPPGRSYFKNFDPKAVRIDVTPTSITNATKTQQVLIATVYDKDGQPRRGRRVEWVLDGPGTIVEVDESGWSNGRGYKVDNKFAVSYTDYLEHCITRGNKDPKDDFTVYPGQTWCVVSSAVPGETTVTAYAPEVFDWEKGRAFVKLTWSDTEFAFPPPATARYGGEANLNTTITRLAEQAGLNPADVKVRYRIASGVPAELIPSTGAGVVAGARSGQNEVDITADPDGRAGVRVVQPRAAAGKTNIAVEILKPDPNGVGPGTVVGRTMTAVEWGAPKLSVEVQAPKVAGLDRESSISVIASNTGAAESSPVNVQAKIPEGLEIVGAEPAPTVRTARDVSWSSGAIAAGQKQEFRVLVKPTKKGSFTTTAYANTEDGLNSRASGTLEVGTAALKLTVDPPAVAATGARIPVGFTINNPSGVPIENATAWVNFDGGLEHDTGKNDIEVTVGTIPAGQTRKMDVPLIARQSGKQKVRISVTGDGGLRESGETTIDVRRSELTVAVFGADKLVPGEDGTYEVRLTNSGEVALPNVAVKASLPRALTAKQADNAGTIPQTSDGVTWQLGSLAPGEKKTFKMSVTAGKQAEPEKIVATATSRVNADSEKAGLTAKGDWAVAVIGQPALTLTLADPEGSVPVGKRAGYRVIVRNRGTGPAKDVIVTVDVPEEYANIKATGANKENVRPEGRTVIYPTVLEIPAGGSATMYLEVEAAKAGDARVKAEVKASYLAQPLREEQATRIVNAGK